MFMVLMKMKRSPRMKAQSCRGMVGPGVGEGDHWKIDS